MASKQLHIVMYPWYAIGHIIPYLHLSNKLAEKGHKITFLLPPKAKLLLEPSNIHPSLITLHPITIPHVDPLPPGSETCSDTPIHLQNYLATAMDRARPQLESILLGLKPKPNLIFYDMAYWVPEVATKMGIKSVFYVVVCAASIARLAPMVGNGGHTAALPSWTEKIDTKLDYGEGIKLFQRVIIAIRSADAIAIRTCHEIEGESCDQLTAAFSKPVLLTGPIMSKPSGQLEDRWAQWLDRFEPKSVVYCCMGSQYVPDKAQVRELALGLEMTGLPFVLAVKTPVGCHSIEEALPNGFLDRVRDRGVVESGWVPQLQILAHPSTGCYLCHCGFGSVWEGLMCESQLVVIPQLPDQVMHADMLAGDLHVAVKVDREEDGLITKESLSQAIKSVMDKESELGNLVNKNHAKWRDVLLSKGFMNDYIHNFAKDLEGLVSS